jgi:hypothetical protein
MQGCMHKLGNKEEGALQQGYNLLMTKEEARNWLAPRPT